MNKDAPRSDEPGTLRIEPGDVAYAALTNVAGRLGSLTRDVHLQSDANVLRSLDDLLGAVYALMLARLNQFEDRPDRPPELQPVITRAEQLERGEIRVSGKWIAGWYFNSALFRIAAVYHRLLKVVSGEADTKKYVGELLRIVQPMYEKWFGTMWAYRNLEAIHIEVTNLKHTPQGVHTRNATFDQAVAGIGELLNLVEAWSRHR